MAFLIFGVLAPNNVHAQKKPTPAAAVKNFYRNYIACKIRGLPTKKHMKIISPLLSQQIRDLIAADRITQAQFIKNHPDEKPPWVEGDLFSSLFEGATAYTIGKTLMIKQTAEVDVHLVYKYRSDATEWTDTVVLKKSAGGWVIENILFKGNWDFKSGASLLKVLK